MHHVLEIIVVGDRNQSVEIFTGKLVLEGNICITKSRKLRNHGGELDVPVNREDLGLASNIRELVVVAPRLDLAAAITTDEFSFVVRWGLLIVPRWWVLELNLSRARRRITRIWV
ncbi:hypothetical protein L6164_032679 [Bauhinia variegata]|uniref:Uncharacterized protein n=1 Tax=Bauhinia variegata TaxID=167791 RepID=A0ACB9KPJ7_BAUVA|nr:hypothetical protein L6164_032679 [Bauhinia variegata]